MTSTPDSLRQTARRLATELHFQPSEIDRLTLCDAAWWLGG